MKVFLLEDDVNLLRLYRLALERDGFVVEGFASVKALIDELWVDKPDLLLVDYGLQGESFNGLRVVRLVKKLWPRLKVGMLTNFDQPSFVRQSFCSGVDQFFVKFYCSPFSLGEALLSGRSITKAAPCGLTSFM